jgi:hypothetical protein
MLLLGQTLDEQAAQMAASGKAVDWRGVQGT